MNSLYFDDSLYENQLHYKLAKYLEKYPIKEDEEELVIKCDNEEQYNQVLDALYKAKAGTFKAFGTSKNPFEIIVEEDPRSKYRSFDESCILDKKIEVSILNAVIEVILSSSELELFIIAVFFDGVSVQFFSPDIVTFSFSAGFVVE